MVELWYIFGAIMVYFWYHFDIILISTIIFKASMRIVRINR
jgi:hypothetical protein